MTETDTAPDRDRPGGTTGAPDPIRVEAERLMSAGIAAVSAVADRIGAPTRERGGAAAAGFDALGDALFGPASRRPDLATGSAACCRCPVCRVIDAARRPDPGLTGRVAAGVGTLAGTATRVLRTAAGLAGGRGPDRGAPRDAGSAPAAPAYDPAAPAYDPARDADPWAAATADAAAPGRG